jgi:photosystem II stability/assembly factor-like uncharacterized protein
MKLARFFLFAVFSAVPLLLTSSGTGGFGFGQTGAPQAPPATAPLASSACKDLAFRCIGPTLTSGRIAAIAIDPRESNIWYVAAAAGGLWKTADGGTSFKCVTDDIGSFSMGAVAVDPANSQVIWLGTGEQQSQRSVDFGDGVYRSADGGNTWVNMGLTRSEHIARICIDPRNTEVVYVAAQGPLWASGGDRGIFKTINGGKTWQWMLQISENTGVTDLVMDPRNPDLLYAASFQRRRHTGVAVGGGPECAIFKSEDAGVTWTKLTQGLPTADMGRIALAMSPQNSGTLYAQITAAGGQSGFYRTDDQGSTWKRITTSGPAANLYYGEIFADPHQAERVFITAVNLQMTEDGGKTFKNAPLGKGVHVDHHALAFDLKDPKHILLGNDGGLYETKDGMKTWRHFPAVAVSQFYRMCVDNAVPFFNVYAGAQDNGSQGGPSRTVNKVGICTADWRKVGGGDGFQGQVDPNDPKIIYTMSQGGAISRAKKSIKPKDGGGKGGGKGGGGMGGGGGVRWNWDTPFIISPHSPQRLYLAANVLYRSDDRGDAWKAISPDLTRKLDRNAIPVMGKIWPAETPAKNQSTTALSVCNALEESPIKEGLIYVGTNDGLVQITENAGESWRKLDRFPGVPIFATVSDICPSHHDVDTVYVSFHNYEAGDFRPYLLKSTDRGKTWSSIAGDLPDRQFIWSVEEDSVNRNLLFAGTEFGIFFTGDGGKHWVQLKGGVPTISFRDMVIHKRESDLVCGTFGRGLYILDDITPLRLATPEVLAKEVTLFPPRKTYVYEEKTAVQPSANHSEMPNPPFGALITYHLRDDLGEGAKIVLTVTDAEGKKLQHINGPATAGFHRVTWDLRPEGGGERDLVKPGKFKVMLGKQVRGELWQLGDAQVFEVVPLLEKAKEGGR